MLVKRTDLQQETLDGARTAQNDTLQEDTFYSFI